MSERPITPDRELLDRLVEGTLPDELRRDVLIGLDANPEGWRLLALAFLEDQAWREALGPLRESASRAEVDLPATPPARRRLSSSRAVGWLARAAAVVAAFGLGWAGHAARQGPRTEVAKAQVQAPRPEPTPPAPLPEEPETLVASEPEPVEPPSPPVPAPWREQLPWTGPAAGPPVTLTSGESVSEYARRQLERQGYRVESRVGVLVGSGESAGVVPVEQVRIRYVGDRTY